MFSSSVQWNSPEVISPTRAAGPGRMGPRNLHSPGKQWALVDVFTVVLITAATTLYRLHLGPRQGSRELIHGSLIPGSPMAALFAYVIGYAAALVLISRRLRLYSPAELPGYLCEQRLSLQACLSSSLLLAGALYLAQADAVPPSIVIVTAALVTACLGLRRLLYRAVLYRRLRRGLGVRNVLIVGVGASAQAVRHYLEGKNCLRYRFRGFVQVPGEAPDPGPHASDIVAGLDELFDRARADFVEEILVASPDCGDEATAWMLNGARSYGIDLRLIPQAHNGLAWQNPVEYLGPIPTMPLHARTIPELGWFLKRSLDVVFSLAALLLLSPLFAVIAAAIKMDSPGPVFYLSERMGKKGRIFRCIKFRTMVVDAEARLAALAHLNERDGVLFKVSNDPRITRLGRWLRKYSLDELPQFVNVLKGEMSVVGPRPPLGNEVKKYELDHLRRLEVTPGITGLWQVENRQDPSFASYISLDVRYIDNWSPWLDLKIILRTIGVVLAGTGC